MTSLDEAALPRFRAMLRSLVLREKWNRFGGGNSYQVGRDVAAEIEEAVVTLVKVRMESPDGVVSHVCVTIRNS